MAAAMRDKISVKKEELKLRCITALPGGPQKTELLMAYLKSANI